ncbi:Na+/Pi-cotransporter [Symmachiella dynata]|uniref:Na/Pi cotransporter family protein n=1 Tax=Symmachiella dynata TaxID=2527995 RepID=UPI00118A880A|nr:Na/Pi cotransporter family protein [Symmachiella dynata]QDT46579.1 Na+/Pi-cotransporter [Symmachiella dynata]
MPLDILFAATGGTAETELTSIDLATLTQLIFGAVGGLGLFLLGMKNMSEGMQAVAGSGLRRMISAVTDNRYLATIVGVVVTCFVQSSSVTTVMVVGFVNGSLMTLSQAIGVIMGANIGTTITGWILVLKIGKYGLPMLGLAAFVYLFSKNDRLRYLAMTFMGVGMVFFGLELMKDSCALIKDLPAFEAAIHRFTADSAMGVAQCLLVGCILTVLVQSSSATLGITIAAATQGLINYETAAALVLGENIGTTITALLASIGATTNARRAAYFHVLFNMVGVLWISIIFFQYVRFIPWLTFDFLPRTSAFLTGSQFVPPEKAIPNVALAIAATHTVFNLANTLVFLPFGGRFAKTMKWLVPDTGVKETPHLTNLDVRMLETPVIGIEQSRGEIIHMGEGCEKMMAWLKELTHQDTPDEQLKHKLFHREEVLDSIQDEVVVFMTNLLSANVPHEIIEEGRQQLRMADELESISDYIRSILKFDLKLRQQGHRFDAKHRADLDRLHEEAEAFLKFIVESFKSRQGDVMPEAQRRASEIKRLAKKLRKQHVEWLSHEKVPPFVSVAFTSTLNSYVRVRDHALNVAEALSGEK